MGKRVNMSGIYCGSQVMGNGRVYISTLQELMAGVSARRSVMGKRCVRSTCANEGGK